MPSEFEPAVAEVLRHEGGYVDHPADRGGATAYGISSRSYPGLDMRRLTRQDAEAIYRRDFWDRGGYSRIESQAVANKVMDLSVVMGPAWAVRLLQRALRAVGFKVLEDGRLGPKTLAAVNDSYSGELLAALRSEAAGRFREIVARNQSQVAFIVGWEKRSYDEI